MKKLLFTLIVIFVTMFTSVAHADIFNTREVKESKIKLAYNGGNCSHLAEELFYQYYGVWFNFPDNKTKHWRTLKSAGYRVNGVDYKIKFSKEPMINSIMFIDNGSGLSHVAWVYDVTKTQNDTIISVIESSTTGLSELNIYGDCWYRYMGYYQSYHTNVTYIYAEIQ